MERQGKDKVNLNEIQIKRQALWSHLLTFERYQKDFPAIKAALISGYLHPTFDSYMAFEKAIATVEA